MAYPVMTCLALRLCCGSKWYLIVTHSLDVQVLTEHQSHCVCAHFFLADQTLCLASVWILPFVWIEAIERDCVLGQDIVFLA